MFLDYYCEKCAATNFRMTESRRAVIQTITRFEGLFTREVLWSVLKKDRVRASRATAARVLQRCVDVELVREFSGFYRII
jgi:Fe2+ or Zn2+ uptake regulation protein